MDGKIMLQDILGLSMEKMKKFNLHLAAKSNGVEPLDVFATNREEWREWNEYRDGKNVWTRDYIFTLIPDYHKQNRYVFGGVYQIIERFENWQENLRGYHVELDEMYNSFIGRLYVEFYRYPGLRRRNYLFENFIESMCVAEITEMPYSGEPFPGFDNVNISFSSLEIIYSHHKQDWYTALENVKGVYLITDSNNGKKYVGSAYGDNGIWSRWADYAFSGTGGNDELVKIIEKNGLDYARKYFKFSILELFSMKTDNDFIITRECFWKSVLLTRGEFGYNKN